jgi:type I restriction enzyme, S subunit
MISLTNVGNRKISWIDVLPTGWQLIRLKWTTNQIRNGIWGDEPKKSDDDVICVRVADFDRIAFRVILDKPTLRNVPHIQQRGRLLKLGDLLIEKSGGGELQPVGTVVIYDKPDAAVCSNFIARVEIRDGYNPRFLTYLHAHLYIIKVNTRSIKQTTGIQNLDSQSYFDEFVCVPSLETQKSIASFLDRKTAAIDTLIAKKQRLIQLLEEKRTALIDRAVTKGLNPNVPMKESGILSIGAVPQHWEVLPLKYITSLSGGSTPDKSNTAYWNGSIPWISAKDMKRFLIGESIDYITELATQETSIRIIQPPVILVVVRGMILAHSFPVAITTNPLTVNQDIKTITCSDKTIIEFLARHLSACKDGVLSLIQEAGHGTKALRTDLFEKLPILLPPIQEQQEICSYVNNHSKKFADIILCLNKRIEKLQEYRRSLITAAVTGKLDISEVEPNE